MVSSPGPGGPPRLGLLVSKRCGSAVRRNRIKRRLRSVADEAELQPGIDYVIIATGQVAEVPYERLRGWLESALREAARA
jgi:ribonuclease P protein component